MFNPVWKTSVTKILLPTFNKLICDVVLFFCCQGRKYLLLTKVDSGSEVVGNCFTNNQQIESKLKLQDKQIILP